MHLKPIASLIIGCLAVVTACSDSLPAGPDVSLGTLLLQVVSGDQQAGNSGQELPRALVVRVLDGSKKRALPGIPVSFVAVEGGGRFYAGSTITDLEGYAADYWTPGPKAGRQRAEARAVIGPDGERRVFGEFAAWVVGIPAKLSFSVEPPKGVVAGTPMSPAVRVQVQDDLGQHVTGATTAILLEAPPPAAALGGTVTKAAVGGIATFDDLVLTKAGRRYVLTASAAGLAPATSDTIGVIPAPAFQLAFLGQPPDWCARTRIPTAVEVAVQDAFGNTAFGSSVAVTLGLIHEYLTGVLTGTPTVLATDGIAVFDDLMVDPHGSSYRLTASATGLVSAESNEFTALKCAVLAPPIPATSP